MNGVRRIQLLGIVDNGDQESIYMTICESQSIYGEHIDKAQNGEAMLNC